MTLSSLWILIIITLAVEQSDRLKWLEKQRSGALHLLGNLQHFLKLLGLLNAKLETQTK